MSLRNIFLKGKYLSVHAARLTTTVRGVRSSDGPQSTPSRHVTSSKEKNAPNHLDMLEDAYKANDYDTMAIGFKRLADDFAVLSQAKPNEAAEALLMQNARRLLKAQVLHEYARKSSIKAGNDAECHDDDITDVQHRLATLLGAKNVDRALLKSQASHHQDTLQCVRRVAREGLEKGVAASQLYEDIASSIKGMARQMIDEVWGLLGGVPAFKHNIVILGSFARREGSPYSDFEFAVLIEDLGKVANDINKHQIRIMTLLLFSKIIALGETTARMMDIQETLEWMDEYDGLIPKGFSMDGQMVSGCHTPLGNYHHYDERKKDDVLFYELIGTPQELAQYQDKYYFKRKIALSTVLASVDSIVGNDQNALISDYQRRMKQIWEGVTDFPHLKVQTERSLLQMIRNDNIFYPKSLRAKKDIGFYFNAKYDLYRLPNLTVENLAFYYGVTDRASIFQRWDRVCQIMNLPANAGKRIKTLIDMILKVRTDHYLSEGRRVDTIQLNAKGDMIVSPTRYIAKKDVVDLFSVLTKYHKALKEHALSQLQNKADGGSFGSIIASILTTDSASALYNMGLTSAAVSQLPRQVSPLMPQMQQMQQLMQMLQPQFGQTFDIHRSNKIILESVKNEFYSTLFPIIMQQVPGTDFRQFMSNIPIESRMYLISILSNAAEACREMEAYDDVRVLNGVIEQLFASTSVSGYMTEKEMEYLLLNVQVAIDKACYSDAYEYALKALEKATASMLKYQKLDALHLMAIVALKLGNLDLALVHIEDAMTILDSEDNTFGQKARKILDTKVTVLMHLGRYDEAERLIKDISEIGHFLASYELPEHNPSYEYNTNMGQLETQKMAFDNAIQFRAHLDHDIAVIKSESTNTMTDATVQTMGMAKRCSVGYLYFLKGDYKRAAEIFPMEVNFPSSNSETQLKIAAIIAAIHPSSETVEIAIKNLAIVNQRQTVDELPFEMTDHLINIAWGLSRIQPMSKYPVLLLKQAISTLKRTVNSKHLNYIRAERMIQKLSPLLPKEQYLPTADEKKQYGIFLSSKLSQTISFEKAMAIRMLSLLNSGQVLTQLPQFTYLLLGARFGSDDYQKLMNVYRMDSAIIPFFQQLQYPMTVQRFCNQLFEIFRGV